MSDEELENKLNEVRQEVKTTAEATQPDSPFKKLLNA